MGMRQAVAFAGLSREMDHALKAVCRERLIDGGLLGEIGANEGKATAALEARAASPSKFRRRLGRANASFALGLRNSLRSRLCEPVPNDPGI